MIERAVFSYYNFSESFDNRIGFKYFDDFLYTTTLAILLASRQFREVQMMSSTWGVNLFKKLEIPVTEFSTMLDCMKNIPSSFWAYGKLIAYNSQTKPFVHIDNDVFLHQPLPKRILEAELCFQSKEFFHLPGYKWYDALKPCWRKAPVRPEIIVNNEIMDFTYNCGICGGWNPKFFKEWLECSSLYILSEENQPVLFNQFKYLLPHQNLFHEQYFGASLIKAHKMRNEVEVIVDDINDPNFRANNKMYTHLWGVTKTNDSMMLRVRNRLKKEDPELFSRVELFCQEMGLSKIDDKKEERNIVTANR